MDGPNNTIASAFKNFEKNISVEDANTFANTELKDVWKAVRDIDTAQRRRLSARNLARVEPLLRGIEKYSKVIEVLCNGTPYMPYVWGPIKLMLQLASNYRDVFESLLNAYAEIGRALPRFDRFGKAFEKNHEFQNVLASVYRGILDFHQRAYKFFRRRAWHILFSSLWKDFGSQFSGILESLKTQRDFLDKEAASFDIVEGKEARVRQQEEVLQRQKRDLEILERDRAAERVVQLQHSLEWLSNDDKIQEAEKERLSIRRHDQTCEWVTKEPKMKAWLKDDMKQPILWLSGKPGAGKSVMCSHIAHVLSEIPDMKSCYYFCSSHDSENVSNHILGALATQLLRKNLDAASLIANEFIYQGVSCSTSQLRNLVPKLLELASKTRIIIDGLDECSPENQRAVLKDLHAVCFGPEIRCKVIFSSRRENDIHKRLCQKPQIVLDGREEVESDIRSYIKYKVAQLRTSDATLLAKIESVLVNRANGMFLWVRLVVEELRYCYNDASLEQRAMAMPKGLKAAYGRILERIMDDFKPTFVRDLAMRILGWMAGSRRTVKSYEILDGISLFPGCTELNAKTKMRIDVLDLCRPLIEDGPRSTVDFVHFSAKEYILEAEPGGSAPFIDLESANFNILFACLCHLNNSIGLLNGSYLDRASVVVKGFHGLQLYASQFWIEHLLFHCEKQARKKVYLLPELLDQLQLLLRFRKMSGLDTHIEEHPNLPQSMANTKLLERIPNLRNLVSDVITFRSNLDQDESTGQSPNNIQLESCHKDPTHFSTIRQQYQLTLESLLNDEVTQFLQGINAEVLQKFRQTFGPSAHVCRYLRCPRATDGFESSKQRDSHETSHQRKYRCAYPKCVFHTNGFANKASLTKHNETYHAVVEDVDNLASKIAVKKVRKEVPKFKLALRLRNPNLPETSRAKSISTTSSPGVSDQLQSMIMQVLSRETNRPGKWRENIDLEERRDAVFKLMGHMRVYVQSLPKPPTIQVIMNHCVTKEMTVFSSASDKDKYWENLGRQLETWNPVADILLKDTVPSHLLLSDSKSQEFEEVEGLLSIEVPKHDGRSFDLTPTESLQTSDRHISPGLQNLMPHDEQEYLQYLTPHEQQQYLQNVIQNADSRRNPMMNAQDAPYDEEEQSGSGTEAGTTTVTQELIGGIDAPPPPPPWQPALQPPQPPHWLRLAVDQLSARYPGSDFECEMRHTSVSTETGMPCPAPRSRQSATSKVKWMYLPRVRCHDCHGKLYALGPDITLRNFEHHLDSFQHLELVEIRIAAAAREEGMISAGTRSGTGQKGKVVIESMAEQTARDKAELKPLESDSLHVRSSSVDAARQTEGAQPSDDQPTENSTSSLQFRVPMPLETPAEQTQAVVQPPLSRETTQPHTAMWEKPFFPETPPDLSYPEYNTHISQLDPAIPSHCKDSDSHNPNIFPTPDTWNFGWPEEDDVIDLMAEDEKPYDSTTFPTDLERSYNANIQPLLEVKDGYTYTPSSIPAIPQTDRQLQRASLDGTHDGPDSLWIPTFGKRISQVIPDAQFQKTDQDITHDWYNANDGPWIPKGISKVVPHTQLHNLQKTNQNITSKWYTDNYGPWIPKGTSQVVPEAQSQESNQDVAPDWYNKKDGPWISNGISRIVPGAQFAEPPTSQDVTHDWYNKNDGPWMDASTLESLLSDNSYTFPTHPQKSPELPFLQPPLSDWWSDNDGPWIPKIPSPPNKSSTNSKVQAVQDDPLVNWYSDDPLVNSYSSYDPLVNWYSGNDRPWIPKIPSPPNHSSTNSKVQAVQDDPLVNWYSDNDGPWVPKIPSPPEIPSANTVPDGQNNPWGTGNIT